MSRVDLVTVKLLFFAKARELIGEKELFDTIPRNISGSSLLNLLCKKYELDRLKCNVILALNENWVDLNSDLILKEADEIAIIPPLSGDKLNIENIYNKVCSKEFGAVSIFVGTTRDNFNGKIVTKLEYEAYEEMAIKCLKNLCQNIRDKFDVGHIAILHRLGDVPVQEASVIIAISSVHRQSGLNSVSFAIDALKADVPIWKKEIYSNNEPSMWKENSESKEIFFENKHDIFQSVHLYEETVEADLENNVPPHLIQVKANLQEINRRINSFIDRKRQQINMSNIKNFLSMDYEQADKTTCARVSAILKRPNGSMSHLKVHKVDNAKGPQTHEIDFKHSSFETDSQLAACPSGAEERLINAENYLNISTEQSKNVFSRLKAIEDKIIFLESISPEYFDSGKHEHKSYKFHKNNSVCSKKTYSTTELDVKLKELEAKLQKKSKTQTLI